MIIDWEMSPTIFGFKPLTRASIYQDSGPAPSSGLHHRRDRIAHGVDVA
jgi:hypothetical protein